MEDSKAKWIRFGLGASPTLLFILMAIIQPRTDAGITIFFASFAYLVIGSIIAAAMDKSDPDKKALYKSFNAGVVTGFFATFLLSATLCFS